MVLVHARAPPKSHTVWMCFEWCVDCEHRRADRVAGVLGSYVDARACALSECIARVVMAAEFFEGVEASRTEPANVQPLTLIGSYGPF